MVSTESALARVLAVAARQRGVVTRAQVQACGISPKRLARLIAEGWLCEIRPGAFVVAGRAPSGWDAAVAVSLLSGPGVTLSHKTAAAIHRFPGLLAPSTPELTVELPRHPRVQGAVFHRVPHLDPRDIEPRDCVQVTTAARTVCDIAGGLDPALLARVIDEGSIARLWTMDQLAETAARAGDRGRRGSRMLRQLLDVRRGELAADSMLELRIIRMLAPFAPFVTHYQLVLDGEVVILDIAWPALRVGAEVDGWSVRSRSFGKFHHGRHRDNLLLAHGWRVAHLTAAMDERMVLNDVGRLLPPDMWARVPAR
jgi:hypothetical protein